MNFHYSAQNTFQSTIDQDDENETKNLVQLSELIHSLVVTLRCDENVFSESIFNNVHPNDSL